MRAWFAMEDRPLVSVGFLIRCMGQMERPSQSMHWRGQVVRWTGCQVDGWHVASERAPTACWPYADPMLTPCGPRVYPTQVAPMMGWTDHHFRQLCRMLTKHTLLYTEMYPASQHFDLTWITRRVVWVECPLPCAWRVPV